MIIAANALQAQPSNATEAAPQEKGTGLVTSSTGPVPHWCQDRQKCTGVGERHVHPKRSIVAQVLPAKHTLLSANHPRQVLDRESMPVLSARPTPHKTPCSGSRLEGSSGYRGLHVRTVEIAQSLIDLGLRP